MKLHPAASDHVPWFITAPGVTDALMVAMSVILIGAVLGVGVLFFRLHSLPERMAHKSKKFQVEVVAILCLLALFTHVHLFWVAALLLAIIDLPDFSGAFNRMAGALEKIAGLKPPPERNAEPQPHIAAPPVVPREDAPLHADGRKESIGA
jgi:hypothetical protein